MNTHKSAKKAAQVLAETFGLQTDAGNDLNASSRWIIAVEKFKNGGLILEDTYAALKILGKKYGFSFEIILRPEIMRSGSPKHLILTLKEPLNSWRNVIKCLNDHFRFGNGNFVEDTINSLTCVRPAHNQGTYIIVVNDDYGCPIEVSRAIETWDLLFRVAEGEKIPFDQKFKQNIDYLNCNRSNKLYKETGLSLTKIIGRKGKNLVPIIQLLVVTEKAYQRRVNQEKVAA